MGKLGKSVESLFGHKTAGFATLSSVSFGRLEIRAASTELGEVVGEQSMSSVGAMSSRAPWESWGRVCSHCLGTKRRDLQHSVRSATEHENEFGGFAMSWGKSSGNLHEFGGGNELTSSMGKLGQSVESLFGHKTVGFATLSAVSFGRLDNTVRLQ